MPGTVRIFYAACYCWSGHESSEAVLLINDENEPFPFSFDEASCQVAGFTSKLSLEPMQGIVPPMSRCVQIKGGSLDLE